MIWIFVFIHLDCLGTKYPDVIVWNNCSLNGKFAVNNKILCIFCSELLWRRHVDLFNWVEYFFLFHGMLWIDNNRMNNIVMKKCVFIPWPWWGHLCACNTRISFNETIFMYIPQSKFYKARTMWRNIFSFVLCFVHVFFSCFLYFHRRNCILRILTWNDKTCEFLNVKITLYKSAVLSGVLYVVKLCLLH